MLESCSNILECEEILVSNLSKINLMGDIALSFGDTRKLENFISERSLIDISDCTEFLKHSAPTSLACYLVWKGILCYNEGDFWTSIEAKTGLSDPNWKSKWGNIFLRVLRNQGIRIFETKDAHKYVTNILIQGTIPYSCLFEFYDKVLLPLVTKELISSDSNEINSLLRNWRDYEYKRLEKEEQLKELENIKVYYIQKIAWIYSIIEFWNEFEGLQFLKSKIESIDEPDIEEIIDLKNKTYLEVTKIDERISEFEVIKDKYAQDLNNFSEEDSFILSHSETIEDGLKTSLDLITGKKEAAELQKKTEIIKQNIDGITDLINKTDLEIIDSGNTVEDLEVKKNKYFQDLSKFSEEDIFILNHSEEIENGFKTSIELIAGKKEVSEQQEKIEFIKKSIDENIDSKNKIMLEIINTSKCIVDLKATQRKCAQDLNNFSEEDSFILSHSETIDEGFTTSLDLIAGKKEVAVLQENIESVKKNIDEITNSRNKTDLETVEINKRIGDLEATRGKYAQDLINFSGEDSFILNHSETICEGLRTSLDLIAGKKEVAVLQEKIESVKKDIDETIYLRNKTDLEITEINNCIADIEATQRKYAQDLRNFSEEDSFILSHSETIDEGLTTSLDLIAGKKEVTELQEKINFLEKSIDEITNLRSKTDHEIIEINKRIGDLEATQRKYAQDLSKFSKENSFILNHSEIIDEGLTKSLDLIAGKKEVAELQEKIESIKKSIDEITKEMFDGIWNNQYIDTVRKQHSRLSIITSVFKKKEKTPLRLFYDEIRVLLNGSPLDNEKKHKQTITSVSFLKEISKLYDDYFTFKEKISEIKGSNQELEAKLSTIINSVCIGSDDLVEIQIELTSLNNKVKISKERYELAQTASVEIEKIKTEIENELNYQAQLKTKLCDLELKEAPKLYDDYFAFKEKISKVEAANQTLEAKLNIITNSVEIGYGEDIKEVQMKLASLFDKLKASQEHSKLAQTASIEIEKINEVIKNKLNYLAQMKTELSYFDRDIAQLNDQYFVNKEKMSEIECANKEHEASLSTIANSFGVYSDDAKEIQINLASLHSKIEASQEHKKLAQKASVEIEKINTEIEKELSCQLQLKTKLCVFDLDITQLNNNCFAMKEKISKIECSNQELEARLRTIANSIRINSDNINEIQIKLTNLCDKLETSQKHNKLAQTASVEIEKINVEIENELRHQEQLKSKLNDIILKVIPTLNYNFSLFKDKISRLKGTNKALETELSAIKKLVGIDSDDVGEVQIKLTNLYNKLETSQEHNILAQTASVEIEKIKIEIKNELSYQAKLKTRFCDLNTDIAQLNDDYFSKKEKVSKVECANQELKARLSTITNSIGIDSDEDVEEVQIKLANLYNKVRTSQKHSEIAQTASNEIEKINTGIENELSYKAQLNTELCDFDREIDHLKENSELIRLKHEFDIKKKNLLESYSNPYELKDIIEKLKRRGRDKSLCLEKIKTLKEEKLEIEAQINNLKSISLPIPTLKFFTYVDKPIQRYFLFCEKHAEDFLFQSTKMLRQSIEKGSTDDLAEISLPERIINSFENWWEQHYQISSRTLYNSRNYGSQGFKCPVVYFNYSGEIRARFPPQFLKFTGNPQELYLSLSADGNEIYNEPLRLYHFSESLFESEELDFEIEFPAENYKFQLIHGRKVINSWDIPTGIKTTRPFSAFDYESKKLIPDNEIPRSKVLIVLKSDYLINPADCLFEEGDLYGEWSEYSYRGIDLCEVDTLTIFYAGNNYLLQISEKNTWDIVLSKENILQGIYSGENELYVGKPPSIKVNFKEEAEIDNWVLSIYRKNERNFKQIYLTELKDNIKINYNNNLFEIPLEVEACLGKELAGEFIVRLKNNLHNYDKEFVFGFFPHFNVQFNESIYLPKAGNKTVYLNIQLPENSTLEIRHPAQVISQRDTSLDIVADVSHKDITGILKYSTFSGNFTLPINVKIPRVTWSLKGLRDEKYNKEISEILEVPDDVFYYISGESLLLKISFPSSISGICTLKHQDSGQAVNSKIKDGIAAFNILRFNDTVKATSNPVQTFVISVSNNGNGNTLIDDNPLFSIRKWTIQNIFCEQNKEVNKRTFHVKWDQEGSTEKPCIVFWRLGQYDNDKVNLKEVDINGSQNSLYFDIDEKLVKPGRYLLYFTRKDSWLQDFPGENAPNSKEIYIDINNTETSLLELGNKEFDAGNYIKAIDIYRQVPKSASIGLVWYQKISNGLVHHQKYSEALNVLYHLLKNDKQFDDHNCFHVPNLLDRILNTCKDLKDEDLVVLIILLRLIGKNENKYNNSVKIAKPVMKRVLTKIRNTEIQLTNELQLKIKYVEPQEIEYVQNIIRRF